MHKNFFWVKATPPVIKRLKSNKTIKMKTISLFFFLVTTSTIAQTCEWANFHYGTGGYFVSRGNTVYTTDSLYFYSVGEFTGTVDFDPGSGVDNHTATDQEDIYIQKYRSNGTLIWTKIVGGLGREAAPGVHVRNNELYISGIWYGTVDFDPGPGTIAYSYLASPPYTTGSFGCSLFILKLDTAGTFQWVKPYATGESFEGFRSVETDASGNLFSMATVHERTGGGSTFDMNPGTATDLFVHQNKTGIIVKFDSAGNYVFGKKFSGSTLHTYPAEVDFNNSTIDSNNDLIVVGKFNGNVDFDPGPGTNNISSLGNYDILIMKLNNSGNPIWVKSFGKAGTTSLSEAVQVQVDNNDNIFVTGYLRDTVDINFDAGVQMVNAWRQVGFLMKIDPAGNFVWAKTWEQDTSLFGTHPIDLTINQENNLFICGSFYGSLDLDPGVGVALVNANSLNCYVIELDNGGNFIQGFSIGDTSLCIANSISHDVSGSLYLSGYFDEPVDFDPTSLSLVRSPADYACYTAKYNPSFILTVGESNKTNEMNVFPNPSSDFIRITTTETNARLEIMDYNGKVLSEFTRDLRQATTQVNVAGLSHGIYFVRLISTTGTTIKRFIKL